MIGFFRDRDDQAGNLPSRERRDYNSAPSDGGGQGRGDQVIVCFARLHRQAYGRDDFGDHTSAY